MTEREYANKKQELFWKVTTRQITFEEYKKALYELEQRHP